MDIEDEDDESAGYTVEVDLRPRDNGTVNLTTLVEVHSTKEVGDLSELGLTWTTVERVPLQHIQINMTMASRTGSHIITPTADQLAYIGKRLGGSVSVNNVVHEQVS